MPGWRRRARGGQWRGDHAGTWDISIHRSPKKYTNFIGSWSYAKTSAFGREAKSGNCLTLRNLDALRRWERLDPDFRRLGVAMLLPKVPIGLHGQVPPIGMPEPPRNRRNVDARLDAAGGEQVSKVVVREGL